MMPDISAKTDSLDETKECVTKCPDVSVGVPTRASGLQSCQNQKTPTSIRSTALFGVLDF